MIIPPPRHNSDFTSNEWQDWFFRVQNIIQTATFSQVPTTGFTVTCPSGIRQYNILLNPAGALATGTIVFPTSSVDGDSVLIVSTQTVTTITNTLPTGITMTGAVTSLTANVGVRYIFSGTNWYRVQ